MHPNELTESGQQLAQLLTSLRREGRQQSGLDPALVPPDLTSAYQTAWQVAIELGWPVAGWKIAATNATMQQALRTDRPIYGPVYAGGIVQSPCDIEHSGLCSPIPEVEFQFKLAQDLPPRGTPYSRDEVDQAVGSLHPGIEVAECRFIHDDNFPPLPAILADGAGNGTLVIGPEISDWRARDIAQQTVQLTCDGVVRRTGSAYEAMEHPLVPLTWLANELSATGIGLKAGQFISTGTMTGMLRPEAGQHYQADFGPLGQVSVQFV